MPQGTTDHFYFNPEYTLTAPSSVPEETFIAQANRACILWMKRMARVLGRAAKRRAIMRASPADRMLAFSGTLFLHGQPAHIKRLGEAARAKAKA